MSENNYHSKLRKCIAQIIILSTPKKIKEVGNRKDTNIFYLSQQLVLNVSRQNVDCLWYSTAYSNTTVLVRFFLIVWCHRRNCAHVNIYPILKWFICMRMELTVLYLKICRHQFWFDSHKYPFNGSANRSPVNSICDH